MTSPALPADHRAVLDIVTREGRVDLREQKVRYFLPRRSA